MNKLPAANTLGIIVGLAISLAMVASLRAQTPTPFPILTPSPTATPAASPPSNNPYLDASFRAPRIASGANPSRVLRLSSGKFLTFNGVETLLNREEGCVTRYNSDGSVDSSFQLKGVKQVFTAVEVGNQLLVAGTPPANSSIYTHYEQARQIFRVNDDGSLDSSFSTNAVAYVNIYGLTVQSDGKILVLGDFTYFADNPHNYIVRLLPNGELDSSFHPPSYSRSPFVEGDSAIVLSDGRILIAGDSSYLGGGVARLNGDGTVDSTFVSSTYVASSGASKVILLPKNQIIIAGYFSVPASYPANPTGKRYNGLPLLRLNSDGSVDGTFGCFDPTLYGSNASVLSGRDVALQDDGKLVAVVDQTFSPGIARTTIFRFNSDGSRDTTFHEALLRDFSPGMSDFYTGFPYSIASESSGSILVAGLFNSVDNDGVPRYGLVRLQSDGTSTPFAPETSGVYDYPTHVARFSDGRMWIRCNSTYDDKYGPSNFGNSVSYRTLSHNFARLNANGTWDFSLDLSPLTGDAQYLFLGLIGLNNDRAFIWGSKSDLSRTYFRITADGVVDNTFPANTAPEFKDALRLANDNILLSSSDDAQVTLYETLALLRNDGSNDSAFQANVQTSAPQVARGNGSGDLAYVCVGSYPLAQLPDNKILHQYFSSDYQRFVLTRLNPDGTKDNTFTESRFDAEYYLSTPVLYDPVKHTVLKAQTYIPYWKALTAAQVLSNNTIILTGHFTTVQNQSARGLVRLLPNGTVDTTFNTGSGAQWTTFTENFYHTPTVEGVCVLPNGNLLIIGDFEAFNAVPAPGIALLHSDGSVDTTFSPPVHRIYERTVTAQLLPQVDGSIVLSGAYSFGGENIERSLLRFRLDQPLASIVVTYPAANASHLQCLGIPNKLNRIESSPDPNPAHFTTLATISVDTTGAFEFDDNNPGIRKFYRVAYP